ncbi:beta-hexosaminidase, partial [Striga asiatica]
MGAKNGLKSDLVCQMDSLDKSIRIGLKAMRRRKVIHTSTAHQAELRSTGLATDPAISVKKGYSALQALSSCELYKKPFRLRLVRVAVWFGYSRGGRYGVRSHFFEPEGGVVISTTIYVIVRSATENIPTRKTYQPVCSGASYEPARNDRLNELTSQSYTPKEKG